jgi:predicted neuraminidase
MIIIIYISINYRMFLSTFLGQFIRFQGTSCFLSPQSAISCTMKFTLIISTILISTASFAQVNRKEIDSASRKGIIIDQFIYRDSAIAQCHASALVETKHGLLAAWFGGTGEGNKDVCIYTSRLVKGIWTKPVIAADGRINDSTRYACYNPVLFQIPGGELLLFYKIGPEVQKWTGWLKRSFDAGNTWSKPEQLPDGILGPVRNKPLYLNGWLICPSSTDLNDGKSISGIQPAVIRLSPEKLLALCRSQNGTINQTYSNDNGSSWSNLEATSMVNNNSSIDAITLKDGRHLLVHNKVNPSPGDPEGRGPRSPLNLSISSDGIHWKEVLVLENEKGAEFSYPYIIQTSDGLVHISYTWKRKKIKYIVVQPKKLNS